MPTVALGILPYITQFDQSAVPLVNGQLNFYDQITRQRKAVYVDAAGTVPWANPLNLENSWIPPIYYQTDSPYFIELESSMGTSVWTLPNFTPPSNEGGDVTFNETSDNLVINGQFRFFEGSTFNPAPTTATLIAKDAFYFEKNGTGQNDFIEFITFTPGSTNPSDTPIYYCKYTDRAISANETLKRFVYRIKDVRTLEQTASTFTISMASFDGNTHTVNVSFIQNFGTGGSAEVVTSLQNIDVTPVWQTFPMPFTPPSINGKSIGTNDYVYIAVNMPLHQACEIGSTNWYLKQGGSVELYPFLTYAQTLAELQALSFPTPTAENAGDVITFLPDSYNADASYTLHPALPIGSSIDWHTTSFPRGFLLENGQVLPKSGFFGRLFTVLGYYETLVNGISSVTASSNQITFTCDVPGTVANAPVNGGGVTFSITTPGASGVRQIVLATFSAGSSVTHGSTCSISSPGYKFTLVFIVDGQYLQAPVITDSIVILIPITSGWTNTQVRDAVLAQLMLILPNGFASCENYATTYTAGQDNFVCTSLRLRAVVAPAAVGGSLPFTVTPIATGSDTVYNQFNLQCVAGNLLTTGMYLLVSTQHYTTCFWVLLDGEGTQPSGVTADYFMPIACSENDSEITLAANWSAAINAFFFQVPNTMGTFRRNVGDANFMTNDPGPRYATAGSTQSGVGSYEWQDFKSHNHPPPATYDNFVFAKSGGTADTGEPGTISYVAPAVTGLRGGLETRPINKTVYFLIKGY